MNVERILTLNAPSFLIIDERMFKDIVVGVPHHAPAGTPTLPCARHPDSDENAGFLGRYIAEKLDCSSIIACNYIVDVNKFFRSDYSMQIAGWDPKVLVEIHGHGGTKANYDIEISSGASVHDKFSMALADRLSRALSKLKLFKTFSISGEYAKLYFQAGDSVTITDGRWIAYHIELPPRLRKPAKGTYGKPPNIAYRFCDALVDVLLEMYRK